jgi:hypothetical protein
MDSRPMKPRGKCKRWNPKTIPLYVFSTTIGPALEGLSPLPFHTRTCLYPLCYRGVLNKFHDNKIRHSLSQTPMFDFK